MRLFRPAPRCISSVRAERSYGSSLQASLASSLRRFSQRPVRRYRRSACRRHHQRTFPFARLAGRLPAIDRQLQAGGAAFPASRRRFLTCARRLGAYAISGRTSRSQSSWADDCRRSHPLVGAGTRDSGATFFTRRVSSRTGLPTRSTTNFSRRQPAGGARPFPALSGSLFLGGISTTHRSTADDFELSRRLLYSADRAASKGRCTTRLARQVVHPAHAPGATDDPLGAATSTNHTQRHWI